MDFGVVAVVGMVVYAIFIVLGVVLMVVAIRLLLGLIRLVKTLNDYWRMRTIEHYEAGQEETE